MRPLEEIKQDPRRWALGVRESNAVIGACIDYLYKGQHETQRKHEEQAKVLRQAIEIIGEHGDYLTHNLSGRVIHDPMTGKHLTLCPEVVPDSPVHAQHVIGAFLSVVQDHADWLEHPHNIDFTERNNRHFLTFLGRHWRRAGLEHPGIQKLREITIIATGHDDTRDDADLLKAFRNGWQVSEKRA